MVPPVMIGETVTGVLEVTQDVDPNFSIYDGKFHYTDYAFKAGEEAEPLVVTVSSHDFQPECYLMLPPTQETIAWSLPEEAAPDRASFRFAPKPGLLYVVRVTSVEEQQEGGFALEIRKDSAFGEVNESSLSDQ